MQKHIKVIVVIVISALALCAGTTASAATYPQGTVGEKHRWTRYLFP